MREKIITKGNQKTDLEDENNQQPEHNLIESSGSRKNAANVRKLILDNQLEFLMFFIFTISIKPRALLNGK